tara:strand:+ start:474 stop:809 length:336 start_codon:yes stop_codon:yes gene_type:complete
MKVFEVGLICEIEGGRGELMSGDGNLMENIRSVLIKQARDVANSWDVDFDDDDTYEDCSDYKFCDEYKAAAEQALAEIKIANSIDDLRKVRIEKLHLKVFILEREVKGDAA